MNSRTLGLAAAVCFVFCCYAKAQTTGLVAWWPGAGNGNDVRGTNDALLLGGVAFAPGKVGEAFSLDGDNDYLAVAGSPALDFGTGDFSLEMWAKFSAFDRDRTLFHKSVGTYPNAQGYLLEWDYVLPGGPPGLLRFAVVDTTANANDLYAPVNLQTGIWYHIAAVRVGNTASLFLNGILIGGQTVGNNINTGSGGSVAIGRLTDLPIRNFCGELDEISLYNRVLSTNEIYNIYSSGSSGKGQSIVSITSQPVSQFAHVGSNVTFSVTAYGARPLSYQWRRNGSNILGATFNLLTLNSVGAFDSDCYSVVVQNAFSSIESQWACLAVLADGANGIQPQHVIPATIDERPPGVTNLVFITHGWQPTWLPPFEPSAPSWVGEMTNAIAQYLIANGKSGQWEIGGFYWPQDSWTIFPTKARNRAEQIGTLIGRQMATQGWHRVHLIAHSAGSALIQAVCEQLKLSPKAPTVQTTFLDPFTGRFLEGRQYYGAGANWADQYFAFSVDTDIAGVVLGNSLNSTAGKLRWAYNVDIGGILDVGSPIPFIVGDGTANSSSQVHLSTGIFLHGLPIDFYMSTINGTARSCATGYGFSLSLEADGVDQWLAHAPNNEPYPLCGSASFSQNKQPLRLHSHFDLLGMALSYGGLAIQIFQQGVTMTYSSPSLLNVASPQKTSVEVPPWIAIGVAVTNSANVIQFDAGFTATNTGEGFLSVYWNTNEIGTVDERVTDSGLHTFRFALPNTVTSGAFALSFRLDSFNGISSSIIITNISTGFIGVTEPPRLDVSIENGAPSLQLTAASNFTYLLQSSPNLRDWNSLALILNTNVSARFVDAPITNSTTRFYRALLP